MSFESDSKNAEVGILRLSFQNQSFDKKGLFRCESPVQNQPMIFGYARVSTDGESVGAQVKQLRAAGAEKVFKETASGAKTERAELARAIYAVLTTATPYL